jgi:hypothetical protein
MTGVNGRVSSFKFFPKNFDIMKLKLNRDSEKKISPKTSAIVQTISLKSWEYRNESCHYATLLFL